MIEYEDHLIYLPPWQWIDQLLTRHIESVHRGRDSIVRWTLAKKFYMRHRRKITQFVINSCLNCFNTTSLKVSKKVNKPIVTENVLRRFQMDFVELQNDIDGN